MHSTLFLDHFTNPRNVGELPPPALVVNVANPVCGDTLRLSVLLMDGKIADVKFKTRGCGASIAASSALTEVLMSKDLASMGSITASDIETALGGLAPESQHAAALCVDGVKAILRIVL